MKVVASNLYKGALSRVIRLSLTAVITVTSLGAVVPSILNTTANAAPNTMYTNKGFTSLSLSPDRTAPSGGDTITANSLTENIVGADASSNSFYQTEGLQAPIADSSSIKATLDVDASWSGKSIEAGLWGVTHSSKPADGNAWPILQYYSDGGNTSEFRMYDTMVTGDWTPILTNVTPGNYALEIAYNATNKTYNFYVNGSKLGSETAVDPGSTDTFDTFGGVIFDNYNFGTSDYSVEWSNFSEGSPEIAAPTNLVLKDGNNGYATINPGVVSDTINPVNAQLSWDPVAGATGYSVQVYKDGALVGGSSFGWNGSWVGFAGNNFGDGDGSYTFIACATDSVGNSICSPMSAAYIVDTTAPTDVVVSPLNADGSSYVAGTVHFSVSTTEPHFSYSYIEVNQNGVWKTDDTHGTSSYSGSTLNWGWDSTAVPDGNYTLKVDVVDQAGNTTEKDINFAVDNTFPAPSLNLTSGQLVDGTVTINGTDVEANPSVNYIVATNDTTKVSQVLLNDNTAIQNPTVTWDTTELADGNYTIYYEVKDKAGNDANTSFDVTVDNTAPIINGITFSDPNQSTTPLLSSSVIGGPAVFTVSQTEAHPEKTYVEYDKLFNNTWQKETGSWYYGVNTDLLNVDTKTWTDGTYQIKVNSWDTLNHESSRSQSFSVDNTAPAVSLNLTNKQLVHGIVSVVGNDVEVNPSVNYVTVTNDTTHASTVLLNNNTAIQNPTVTWDTTATADGTYTVYYEAKDLAGNDANTSVDVTVDNTAPLVTIDAATLAGATPTITGTINDSSAVVTVTIDGVAATATNNGDGTWSYTVPSALTVGPHTVSVTAKDTAGNVTDPAATGSIVVAAPVTPSSTTTATPASTDTTTVTPTSTAGVLGDSTTTPSSDSASTDSAVKGASTTNKVADAATVKTHLSGLAWYWWLLIVAAIVAIIWWIVAAARSRSTERP